MNSSLSGPKTVSGVLQHTLLISSIVRVAYCATSAFLKCALQSVQRMGDDRLVTMYRPVGQKELDLIRASGFKAFPARLPHQPIFYPVLTEAYAVQIARDWNTKDAASGFVGYVTRFHVSADFAERYPIQKVGNADALEFWVPAGELEEFNGQIVGEINVIHEFRPL
jgi:hypothetical protein